MEFAPPTRPRDLMWRQCEMEVANGPTGFVYIPVMYLTPESTDPPSPEILLGRATDWIDGVGDVVRGTGQRMFGVDDNDLSIMELKTVTFQANEKS
jgi:type VI secretion system protein ImpE